ncbi:c-type cytochrome [Candidatus Pelagibacter communis]|uniref:c-type cytochrome n=1 Tax=Pelagibacter ubique TaxID=198252 RepID=UPI00094DD840|nr:cytochrome c [Candidatus Pelagibacter ubique]|tara:strand:+ start:222 stop:530 length:309 start_codon:yes stop_codon:yes gene_type:complete
MRKITLLTLLLMPTNLFAEDFIKIGQEIFYNKEACVNCHILNAADGGNNQLSKEHVVNIVTNGYGVMPAYKDKLSEKEIEAVALFVSKEGKNWKNKLSSFVQ